MWRVLMLFVDGCSAGMLEFGVTNGLMEETGVGLEPKIGCKMFECSES